MFNLLKMLFAFFLGFTWEFAVSRKENTQMF